jgi:hypothetical protein
MCQHSYAAQLARLGSCLSTCAQTCVACLRTGSCKGLLLRHCRTHKVFERCLYDTDCPCC